MVRRPGRLQGTRNRIAACLGYEVKGLTFPSGGSESNKRAVRSAAVCDDIFPFFGSNIYFANALSLLSGLLMPSFGGQLEKTRAWFICISMDFGRGNSCTIPHPSIMNVGIQPSICRKPSSGR